METMSTIMCAVLAALIFLVIILLVSGICAICGIASFGFIFVRGLWSLLLIPAALLYGSLIERNIFRTKEVEIKSEKLPQEFDGYRIVQISDLHLRSFAHREKALQRCVEKINALNPDLICFTGDIVTMQSSEIEPLKDILSTLKARDGVLSILGNHDYCLYNPDRSVNPAEETDKVRAAEAAMGWHLLDDECVNIGRGSAAISIVGVQNISASRQFQSFGNLQKALSAASGQYRILLSHDPTHWRLGVLGKEDIALMLSGHTHAMQFSLFGWCPSRYIFREYRGLYSGTTDFGAQYLYVNPGLGETALPARIGVLPEITLLSLRR